MRCTASSTFPLSFLHGTITETESSSLGTGGGSNLPMTTCVIQSRFNSGNRAQNRLRKADTSGTYFGRMTRRCVSSASNPASFNRFAISSVDCQCRTEPRALFSAALPENEEADLATRSSIRFGRSSPRGEEQFWPNDSGSAPVSAREQRVPMYPSSSRAHLAQLPYWCH